MFEQFESVLDYLIKNTPDQCPDEKLVIVNITGDTRHDMGKIQIDATGSWIKEFNVEKFKAELCKVNSSEITLHQGDITASTYKRYSISNTSMNEQDENEPYVKQCEQYLSFIIKGNNYALRKLYPRIKKQLNILTNQYKDINFEHTATEFMYSLDKKNEDCAALLSEAVGIFMLCTTDPDFVVNALDELKAENEEAAVNALYNLFYQRLQ